MRHSDTGKPAAEDDLGGIDALYCRVVWSYIPQRYPDRVTLLRSTEKPAESPDLDWRRVAGEMDVRVLPGNHITCVTQHADVVAEHLRACLEQVS